MLARFCTCFFDLSCFEITCCVQFLNFEIVLQFWLSWVERSLVMGLGVAAAASLLICAAVLPFVPWSRPAEVTVAPNISVTEQFVFAKGAVAGDCVCLPVCPAVNDSAFLGWVRSLVEDDGAALEWLAAWSGLTGLWGTISCCYRARPPAVWQAERRCRQVHFSRHDEGARRDPAGAVLGGPGFLARTDSLVASVREREVRAVGHSHAPRASVR